MKKLSFTIGLMLLSMSLIALACSKLSSRKEVETIPEMSTTTNLATDKEKGPRIQIAILLDVSGSMDGLIEQAKSRLWNIVNTMTTLKYKGKEPQIEIALYAYGIGNFGNYENKTQTENYLSQLTHFTTDLDLISEKLFALQTSGSEEYCGTVIHRATEDLDWGSNEADMKLIYIAGNETFEQGSISYKKSIPVAVVNNIFVNTIHCGSEETGIRDHWRDAALLGKGKFFNIDADMQVRHVVTPYDDKISQCNNRLNSTYIGYGKQGHTKMQNQAVQDKNASSVSSAYMAERAVSKSSKAYKNSSWDLVDATKNKEVNIADLNKKELPQELRNKSDKEIEQVIEEKAKERASIQKEIAELAKLRQAYIDKEMTTNTENTDLGKVINQSIVELANAKGYTLVN